MGSILRLDPVKIKVALSLCQKSRCRLSYFNSTPACGPAVGGIIDGTTLVPILITAS
jgi:hypothetical protein